MNRVNVRPSPIRTIPTRPVSKIVNNLRPPSKKYILPKSTKPTIKMEVKQSDTIPKVIHIVWIGDESLCPHNCIQTWIDMNPTWEVKIWGNNEIDKIDWINRKHIIDMPHLYGKADLMRWEILYHEGGFAVDADSECVKPIPDEWLTYEAFTCYDCEALNSKLVACGYVAAKPNNPLIKALIYDINSDAKIGSVAVHSVGSYRMTSVMEKMNYKDLVIFPSHYFIPEYWNGTKYEGDGEVYAKQHWGSTTGVYGTLHNKKLNTDVVEN